MAPYHESVYHCQLTKLPEFVPFAIFKVPESQLWYLFFEKIENWTSKIFVGP